MPQLVSRPGVMNFRSYTSSMELVPELQDSAGYRELAVGVLRRGFETRSAERCQLEKTVEIAGVALRISVVHDSAPHPRFGAWRAVVDGPTLGSVSYRDDWLHITAVERELAGLLQVRRESVSGHLSY